MFKPSVYGLTGNMGCGKSTVAKFFSEFPDVIIFNADQIAKEILCQKKYSKKLLQFFGPAVFSDGKIDLRKVAQLVFNDFQMLERFENFIHPLTRQSICRKIRKKTREEHSKISFFLVEAPLIYEADWEKFFEAIIVVTCTQTEQYRRLRVYRKLSDEEITKRLARQWSTEEKVRRADFVIDTTCSLEEVKKKVQDLYLCLKGGIRR